MGEKNDSLLWVWLSLAGLTLGGLTAFLYYQCFVKATMYSGMNRPQKFLRERKMKTGKDGQRGGGDEEMMVSGLGSSLLGAVPTAMMAEAEDDQSSSFQNPYGNYVSFDKERSSSGGGGSSSYSPYRSGSFGNTTNKIRGVSPQFSNTGSNSNLLSAAGDYNLDLDEYHDDDVDLPNFRGHQLSTVEEQQMAENHWDHSATANAAAAQGKKYGSSKNATGNKKSSVSSKRPWETLDSGIDSGVHLAEESLHVGQPDPAESTYIPPPARANPAEWLKEELELDRVMDEVVNRSGHASQSIYPPGTPSRLKFKTKRVYKSAEPGQQDAQHLI